MVHHRHNLAREGAVTGILGALTVAAWFFIIDVMQGRPLATPNVLGEVFVFGISTPSYTVINPWAVIAYTLIHLLAFTVIGMALTSLFHTSMVSALARPALLMGFIVFEFFFFGVTLLYNARTGQLFPAWSVLAANFLAALAMGGWLWRGHPSIRRSIEKLPLGAGHY
jgi:hypothetical protein